MSIPIINFNPNDPTPLLTLLQLINPELLPHHFDSAHLTYGEGFALKLQNDKTFKLPISPTVLLMVSVLTEQDIDNLDNCNEDTEEYQINLTFTRIMHQIQKSIQQPNPKTKPGLTPEEIQSLLPNMVQLCWEELQTHKDYPGMPLRKNTTQNYGPEYHYLDKPNDEIITEEQFKEEIAQQLQEKLSKYGYAILYTCKDNNLISLHGPDDGEDFDLDISIWDEHRDNHSELQTERLYFDFD